MIRRVASVFSVGPAEILEMDTEDLAWWDAQAGELIREMKGSGK